MEFKNYWFLEEVVMSICEGNDGESEYEYVNEEYGNDEFRDEWGEDYNKGYKELFSYLEENGKLYFREGDCFDYEFDIDNGKIRMRFVN